MYANFSHTVQNAFLIENILSVWVEFFHATDNHISWDKSAYVTLSLFVCCHWNNLFAGDALTNSFPSSWFRLLSACEEVL